MNRKALEEKRVDLQGQMEALINSAKEEKRAFSQGAWL